MKPPFLRTISRPTALLRFHHRPRKPSIAALNARTFSATQRRPFLDECLVQTHSLIVGIHDITGLLWAATIPLVAFLVRLIIVFPTHFYAVILHKKLSKAWYQYEESMSAIEKKVRREPGDIDPQERQKMSKRNPRPSENQASESTRIAPEGQRTL